MNLQTGRLQDSKSDTTFFKTLPVTKRILKIVNLLNVFLQHIFLSQIPSKYLCWKIKSKRFYFGQGITLNYSNILSIFLGMMDFTFLVHFLIHFKMDLGYSLGFLHYVG